MVVPFVDPTSVDEITFDFRLGMSNTMSIYLVTSGGPTFRTGFQVAVDLTVNGLPHHQTLTDDGAPFWIYDSGFRQGDGPIHEWMPATRAWQTL